MKILRTVLLMTAGLILSGRVFAVMPPPSVNEDQEITLDAASSSKLRQTNAELQKIISELEQNQGNDAQNLEKVKAELKTVQQHLNACTDTFGQEKNIKKDSTQPCMPAKVAWALGKSSV